MARKGYISAEIRKAVMESHDGCVVCGTPDADQCGHLIAESKGGEISVNNLVRMCGRCNTIQGNANVQFASFAPVNWDLALRYAMEEIERKRAAWARYCGVVRPGRVKAKPFDAANR